MSERSYVTRAEAKRRGLIRFYTGLPCSRGHLSERRTANATCVACNNARNKQFYTDNPDSRVRHNAAYYVAHKIANGGLRKACGKRYYEANKPKFTAATRGRKTHVRRATPPWVDMVAIRAVYEEAARLTAATSIPHDVDHIVQLRGKTVCGLHVPWNLRPLPAQVNRGKDNNARMWCCDDCGAVHDRDVNAARNILRAGQSTLTGGAHV